MSLPPLDLVRSDLTCTDCGTAAFWWWAWEQGKQYCRDCASKAGTVQMSVEVDPDKVLHLLYATDGERVFDSARTVGQVVAALLKAAQPDR